MTRACSKRATPRTESIPGVDHGHGEVLTFAYDWEADRWSSLLLGVKLPKRVQFGSLPIQFSSQYKHDLADGKIVPKDALQFTVKFPFPR